MTNTIAARVASLPMSEAERAKALAYVSAGNSIADAILAVARVFQIQSSLKTAG